MQFSAVELEGVDARDRHTRAVKALAGGREEAFFDVGVVREEDAAAQGGEDLGDDVVEGTSRSDLVIGEAVDRRALADVDASVDDVAASPRQVDRQTVNGHEPDRQDVVVARVQARGLDIDREQAQILDRGAGPGEGGLEVVAQG